MEKDDYEMNLLIIKTSIEIFHKIYTEYMVLSYEDKAFYNDVRLLEERIEIVIKDLNNKFGALDNYIKIGLVNDILTLRNSFERCTKIYYDKKAENKSTYFKHRSFSDNSEMTHHTVKHSIPTIYSDYYNDQELVEFRIKEYKDDFDKAQIKTITNKLHGLQDTITQDLHKGSLMINEIQGNIDQTEQNLDRANEELRQAAMYKNKKHTVQYPLYLGSIFGAAGTIVPGIGNAIGAVVGTGIGYAVAKLEKRAIEKIEPQKYEK